MMTCSMRNVQNQLAHKDLVDRRTRKMRLFGRKNVACENVTVSQKAREMTFLEVRNLYFDLVIERELYERFPTMLSWQYSGKVPTQRDQSTYVAIYVTDNNSTHTITLNMRRILDCKATQKDVSSFVEEKTDAVKKFIADILMAVAHANESDKVLIKRVDDFSDIEVEKICDVLTNEGLPVSTNNKELIVRIPRS